MATAPATTPVADVNDPAIAALIEQLTAAKK
jgi:hypothetical protein